MKDLVLHIVSLLTCGHCGRRTCRQQYVDITGAHADLESWMTVVRQLTSAGNMIPEDRDRWQVFRWRMTQNYEAIQAMFHQLAQRINARRRAILEDCCGADWEKRMERYHVATGNLKLAFCERDAHGNPVPANNAIGVKIPDSKLATFEKRWQQVNDAYQDIGKAHELFAAAQQTMMADPITVRLACVDFDAVPPDVGCAYLAFIKTLIMGTPRLKFWHALVAERSRRDEKFEQELLGRINRVVVASHGKPGADVAMAIFDELYGETQDIAEPAANVVKFKHPVSKT